MTREATEKEQSQDKEWKKVIKKYQGGGYELKIVSFTDETLNFNKKNVLVLP